MPGRTSSGTMADRGCLFGPSMGHQEPETIFRVTRSVGAQGRKLPGQAAEARGFEPRKGANPNRISSAAP